MVPLLQDSLASARDTGRWVNPQQPAKRAAGGRLAWWGLGLLLATGGCANGVRVQSLATDQPDRQAYQLYGARLEQLRVQAARLCPLGLDEMRAADQRHDQLPIADGRMARWLAVAATQLRPDPSQAQLTVACLPGKPASASESTSAQPSPGGPNKAAAASAVPAVPAVGASLVPALPAAVAASLPPPASVPVTGYD
jgi:hypothetical protein